MLSNAFLVRSKRYAKWIDKTIFQKLCDVSWHYHVDSILTVTCLDWHWGCKILQGSTLSLMYLLMYISRRVLGIFLWFLCASYHSFGCIILSTRHSDNPAVSSWTTMTSYLSSPSIFVTISSRSKSFTAVLPEQPQAHTNLLMERLLNATTVYFILRPLPVLSKIVRHFYLLD